MKMYLWIVFTGMAAIAILVAWPAYAYVGPGLGVAFIWVLLGPVAGVLAAIAMVGYFPARYFYKKYKKGREEKKKEDTGENPPL